MRLEHGDSDAESIGRLLASFSISGGDFALQVERRVTMQVTRATATARPATEGRDASCATAPQGSILTSRTRDAAIAET